MASPQKRSTAAVALSLILSTVPALAETPKERVDLRTPTSRTFDLGHGRFRAELHQTPIFYRDARGEMRPLRAAWQEAEGSRFVAEANLIAASLDLGGVTLRTAGGSSLRLEAGALRSQADELLPDEKAARVQALRHGSPVGDFEVFPGGVRLAQELAGEREARWTLSGKDVLAVRPSAKAPGTVELEMMDGTRVALLGSLEEEGGRVRAPLAVERREGATDLVLRPTDGVVPIAAAVEVATLTDLGASVSRDLGSGFYSLSFFLQAGKNPSFTNEVDRFYSEWNTSPIPDNATIQSSSFGITSQSSSSPILQLFNIASRPTTNFLDSVWADCGEGNLYATLSFFSFGSQTFFGDFFFNSDLQSRLRSDWMAVGMRNTNETSTAAFAEFSTTPLEVDYSCSCTALAAPTGVTAIATAPGSIALSWVDNSTTEVEFQVERSTNGGAFLPLATVGANVTGFTDNSVTSASTYTYRVRAHNCSCYSAYGSVSVPNAPMGLTGAASAGRLNLAWSDTSANEAGFRIERQSNGGAWTEIAVVGANVTSYAAPLTTGVDYFRVRSYAGLGFSTYTNRVSDAPPFVVSACSWSPGIKESSGTYYTCPNSQILVGRQHSGDENGTTNYYCCSLGNPGAALPTNATWSASLKESAGIAFTCPDGRVLIGRRHGGDENGSTTYQCATLQQNALPILTDSPTCTWSAGIKESSGTVYVCPNNKVLAGRQHNGDENGTTKYLCCGVL